MMASINAPPFPESVQEGTLSVWHKKPGDAVQKNEKVADIETDKIVLEVTAPEAGVLKTVTKKEGDTVAGREVIGQMEVGGAATSAKPAAAAKPSAPAETAEPEPPPAPKAPAPAARPAPAPARKAPELELDDDLPPAVRKLIVENNLNPKEITGTGRGGRITKADVIRHLEHSPHLATKYGDASVESPAIEEIVPAQPAEKEEVISVRRVKMSRLRARIAERLVQAQQTAALLTTFNEVNMKPVMDLRNRYRDAFEKEHGVKLGFMSFFVKAAVEALKKYPVINATVEGDEIVYFGHYHVGVAVSSDRGLVVPVLRNVEHLNLAEIEKGIADFAARAQAGKLDLEELTGGTFTISNGGVFGSLMSTPIINPPQSGILGMHRIQERPVAEDGQVVIRPMMYLALSYDHRIIDGREAVQFLVSIKQNIEDPARLLLQL
ncbi:MAG TPA: 2-oxoglutarate dehydrogenase complex dihydrolipoyllysine-residue succinyltransferase [Kiritimatiellia bacterium]|nr:2-oxoglutarate dehydrogenase complex dihydrolipoyllysine-residue succinyltransferase [Kiritimatiellia bacterium]HMP00651.1 2-oxoglutarate dehydrogenase complex dihydrolipoyllysine-residue succinyltransferase [Kiritimatiellia bacterium]HMP97831.1 2-oxoglutarate dehydrogenase complex dihydrolipoyllysine-residue succinyltransferase [Kiritimatiellia bacterium]